MNRKQPTKVGGMGRKRKKNQRQPHKKDFALIQVGFSEADTACIDRVVRAETILRSDSTIGRATVIREHCMPSLRKRDEELAEQPAVPV